MADLLKKQSRITATNSRGNGLVSGIDLSSENFNQFDVDGGL